MADMTTRRAAALAVLAVGILAGICSAEAQSLDQNSADALAATVRALKSHPAQGAGGWTKDLDPRIRSLGDSPESAREMNDLAAQILTELAERTGGDPAKMNEALARGKSDPSAFAESLSPATRERLHALAAKVPADQR
jgi:hypothetical protein